MRLAQALRLEPGRMVTFTGAGGKTSALRRLAQERTTDERGLLTCTTRLAYSERGLAAHHLIVHAPEDLDAIPDLLRRHGTVLLSGEADGAHGKLAGLPAAWVSRARRLARDARAWVAVEGDGAKGRWLKAPAGHEPEVPAESDVLAPTFNLNALGRSLDEGVAHRPERVAALLGVELGAAIEAGHVVRLLTHERGGLQGKPPQAEVRLQLTGSADPEALRAIVSGLLAEPRVRAAVHVPQAAAEQPLRCHGRVGAVVLAAGAADRMGELKQVMPWRGKPLAAHAVEAARAAGLAPIVVVTGAGAERVRAALVDLGVAFVHNADWQDGQSTSLRRGLRAVQNEVEAAIFLLADMPLVDGDLIKRLVREHSTSLAPIVAPRAGGRWGNPVLFDRVTFSDLLQIQGDQGGRALYDSYPVTGVGADRGALLDLDAPEDLQRLQGQGDDPIR